MILPHLNSVSTIHVAKDRKFECDKDFAIRIVPSLCKQGGISSRSVAISLYAL